MYLVRGHWEAKDSKDDLDDEIAKKIARGYPTNNIIFEDTKNAVLLQNGQETQRIDLQNPDQVASLLTTFFDYVEPQIENFEKAVSEFQQRVPDLAKALKAIIDRAHAENKKFQEAFNKFFELCRTSLNPNLAQAAVDEMLIQHLLTERLIREIFGDSDFDRRNVIAAEIEKVIDALAKGAFNRRDFLSTLDRFYVAIENAARTMPEFSDKQHFLNTVYERFFQGYSVDLADTMGIVYTPQPIVDFMCASVAEVLRKEFGKSLSHDDVHIIDPCTGTGNFIVNLIKRIPKKDLPGVYKDRVFANEIMLLPYYIASLNIEHAYWDQTGDHEAFEGLCFVDTLDLTETAQHEMEFMTAANSARVERQRRTPITIVIGNPPYNMGQQNESDNNKNRAYPAVDARIADTYVRASKATLRNKLYDPYVKFFRWATDRLQGRDGIVCLVTNNSFIDQAAFDGMRACLRQEFHRIYHLDLRGNVRHNPKLSGTAYNVFGIQVGVGITIAVKRGSPEHEILFFRLAEDLRRIEKLAWLAKMEQVGNIKWKRLQPDQRNTWLVPTGAGEFAKFISIGSKEGKASDKLDEVIFRQYSLGIASNRDVHAYASDAGTLKTQAETEIEIYHAALDKLRRKGPNADAGGVIDVEDPHIKWTRQLKSSLTKQQDTHFDPRHVRRALYRPFSGLLLYFDDFWVEERYQQQLFFPTTDAEGENRCMSMSDIAYRAQSFSTLITNRVSDLHLCATTDGHQCFPFYTYDEDGSNRKENITAWALDEFLSHYKDKKITKWDIFYYVYALLHHPDYRTKFADNLKRELPRIPFAPDFRAFATAGQKLADLHLNYESAKPYDLKWIETPAVPLSYRVEKMKLSKDKTEIKINDSLTLSGIPKEVFDYRLGNRSALDWVIDQYQISTDKRSGITSDPNRPDDEQYIVRLVGQVIRVSLETVKIVASLPTPFSS